MKIAKWKQQQWYDNKATLRRELYRAGSMVASWSQRDIEKMRLEDRTIPPWGAHDKKPNVRAEPPP